MCWIDVAANAKQTTIIMHCWLVVIIIPRVVADDKLILKIKQMANLANIFKQTRNLASIRRIRLVEISPEKLTLVIEETDDEVEQSGGMIFINVPLHFCEDHGKNEER